MPLIVLLTLLLYVVEPAAAQNNAATVTLTGVPSSLPPGGSFTASITVTNTGTTTWTPGTGYALGSQSPQDNVFWGTSRIPLSTPVPPGTSVTFTRRFTAPTSLARVYKFAWRMVQDPVEWFGATTVEQPITVGTIIPIPPPPAPAGGDGTVYSAPGQPLPSRRWVERPWSLPLRPGYQGGWTADCNNAGTSDSIWNVETCGSFPLAKHERVFYRPYPGGNGGEVVWAGGDHPVSMVHPGDYDGTGSEVMALDNRTGVFRIVRPFCVPGETQPKRPDNIVWAYDSKRDQGVMMPGADRPSGDGTSGCGAIESHAGYVLDFATRKWIGPDAVAGLLPPPSTGWGGDQQTVHGAYIRATDEIVRFFNGSREPLQAYNRGTKTWRTLPLNVVTGVPPGWNPSIHRTSLAIDQRDKIIYWIDMWSEWDANDPDATTPIYLCATDALTGVTRRIRMPPQAKIAEGTADDLLIAFDPVNRVIFIPNNYDMGGGSLLGLGLYKVDTGEWEWESVPSAVWGSAATFDENVGALVVVGKRSPPYGTFLYKYGVGSAMSVITLPPTPPNTRLIPGLGR